MKALSFLILPLFSSLTVTTPLPEVEPLSSPLLLTRQSAVPTGIDVYAETDKWLFRTPISTFLSAMNTKTPPYLFWPDPRANACTGSPDHPWDFDFKRSCQRHDFGYKNYRDQNRFCKAGKDTIDAQFDRDLREYCASRSWWKRPLCYSTAKTYVAFVKAYTPPFNRGCYQQNGSGIDGSGRDANGRCLPGNSCT